MKVELSQFEGAELLAFLDAYVIESRGQLEGPALDPVLDRLGDANALALWLRERVRLELALAEAVQLHHLLSASLSAARDVATQTRTALLSVRDKLTPSADPSFSAAQTQPPSFDSFLPSDVPYPSVRGQCPPIEPFD
jgi:hypothetical protein